MWQTEITANDFAIKIHHIWAKQSMLLTAGDYAAGKYNTMTVGGGSFGTMWGKPFVQVVVRPTRYTYEFMEAYPSFTLCAFDPSFRPTLKLLGSKSGRDGDKISGSGVTPVASSVVAAPAFEEAELVVECRKVYWDDLDPSRILTAKKEIDNYYPKADFHRIYYGEIVAIHGKDSYRC